MNKVFKWLTAHGAEISHKDDDSIMGTLDEKKFSVDGYCSRPRSNYNRGRGNKLTGFFVHYGGDHVECYTQASVVDFFERKTK
jgi:hypothetical protein